MSQQYLPESQPDPIPAWMTEVTVMTEQQTIERELDQPRPSRGAKIAIAGLFLAVVFAAYMSYAYAATTAVRQGGTADFACCEDADCKTPVGSQYARDWAAKDACVALVEADGKTRYFRQWPMRIDKAGAPPPTCPPKPADETQTVQCVAPTAGSWTQTRTYSSAAAPTCWVAGAWFPTSPPTGACVTPPPPATTALVYSPAVAGTYSNLQGASVSGSVNVRLSGNCTGTVDVTPAGPWVFSVDSVTRNTETFCPYGLIDDGALYDTTTLTNGSHTVTAVSGSLTVSAAFTVNNPLGTAALSAMQAPNPTNPTNTNVTLTWSTVVGATGYQLERCTGASCTAFAALSGATSSPYANTNLPGGFTFNYRVKASDGSRTSISNVVAVVTPVVGTGTASLTWEQDGLNTDGSAAALAGFRVVYGNSATALTRTIDIANPALRTYVVDKLGAGTWYFAVRAYAVNGGESNNSNVASKAVP